MDPFEDRVIVVVAAVVAVEVDPHEIMVHRADDAQQPEKRDRDQEDGQRQHWSADGEFPDLFHEAGIPDNVQLSGHYKSAVQFEERVKRDRHRLRNDFAASLRAAKKASRT